MRIPCVLLLVVAGCASAPSQPPAFRAPLLPDEPAAEPEPSGLVLEGLPTPAARAAQDDDDDDGWVDDFETRQINVLGGVRMLDDGDLDDADLDQHYMLGVELTGLDADTGHGYELGLQHSEDEKGSRDVTLQDLYVGYRYTFELDDLDDDEWGGLDAEADAQPYVSLGVSYARLDADLGVDDEDDSDIGLYVRAGISWWLERMRVGVDYRHLFADFDIEGEDVNGDFDQIALVLGFPF